jgi:hypothetical protein
VLGHAWRGRDHRDWVRARARTIVIVIVIVIVFVIVIGSGSVIVNVIVIVGVIASVKNGAGVHLFHPLLAW